MRSYQIKRKISARHQMAISSILGRRRSVNEVPFRVPISRGLLGGCSTRRARIFNELRLFKGKFCPALGARSRRLKSSRPDQNAKPDV